MTTPAMEPVTTEPIGEEPVTAEPIGTEPIGSVLARARTVVDVRSPGEFAKGAVAGAINLPLFDNGERAEIGTIYKQIGKQEAIQSGLQFFGEKLAPFIQAFEPYRDGEVAVYCARGGMRSGAVVAMLTALGYRVSRLEGGYKAYRNHLLPELERLIPPRLLVLHGRTGVGKTLLLNRLRNRSRNTLDLEDLAQHRSSVFGAINKQPRTQQWFESHLLCALESLDARRPVWIEGESRKVGNVILPEVLRAAMQQGTCVLVTASLETRVDRIVAEYGLRDEATLDQWETALTALIPALGHQPVQGMIGEVRQGNFHPVVRALLTDYYDPRYLHSMRSYHYALEVDSEDLDSAARELEAFREKAPAHEPPAQAAS